MCFTRVAESAMSRQPMSEPSDPNPFRALLLAVCVTGVGLLPAFLVGGMAVPIRDALDIGPVGIGAATACFFGIAGIFASPLGSLVHSRGIRYGLVTTGLVATTSMTIVGLAHSYWLLVVALSVGGCGAATAHPTANSLIAARVGSSRLGVAFGVKQSSVPAITMLAGLAVPAIALTLGWRWAFAVGGLLALGVAAQGMFGLDQPPESIRAPCRGSRPRPGRTRLLLVTVSGCLATAAATAMAVFLTDSAVHAGMSTAAAGGLFALCSALGLGNRLLLGWAVDRVIGSPYALMSVLIGVGACGYAFLSQESTHTFIIGALLAYGAGWAWTGVFEFAIVSAEPHAAAPTTGFVHTGLAVGAAVGPLAFGLLASGWSYQVAWGGAAATALLASGMMLTGRPLGPGRR